MFSICLRFHLTCTDMYYYDFNSKYHLFVTDVQGSDWAAPILSIIFTSGGLFSFFTLSKFLHNTINFKKVKFFLSFFGNLNH